MKYNCWCISAIYVVTNESGKGRFSVQGMTNVLLNGGHRGWQWQKFDKLPYNGGGVAGYKFLIGL
jgi:hypothetical protein